MGTHVRTLCVLHLHNARRYVGRALDGTQERPNVRSHAEAWERDEKIQKAYLKRCPPTIGREISFKFKLPFCRYRGAEVCPSFPRAGLGRTTSFANAGAGQAFEE